jgi:predicted nucleic acid-binding protein
VIAIVDTGPLYAAADDDDRDHDRCFEVLARPDLELVVPAFVVTETCYLIGSRLGSAAEAAFLRALASMEVEAPRSDEWSAIAALVQRYADFPLGATDASVVVLAERLNTDLIVTLDRRHFGALRRRDGTAFRILPD